MKMRITGKISTAVLVLLVVLLSCGNKNATKAENIETDSLDTQMSTMANDLSLDNITDLGLEDQGAKKEIKLKGTLAGSANTLVYLSQLSTSKLNFADSVRTDANGAFEFNTLLGGPALYFITFDKMQPPGVPVVLEGGSKLTIDMTKEDFIKTTVKGDKVNQDMKALYDIYIGHNVISAEFNERVSKINPQTVSQEQRTAIQNEYAQNQANMLSDLEKFVTTHKGSLVSYFAATYIIPKTPISLTEKALKQMKKDAPSLPQTQELQARLESIKPLDIGGLAPEIALKSPEGEVLKLSDLKGKVVLIDFWASWCGPCRRENPNVVKAYAKYKDRGFEIYGVSLDKDARKWKAAIEKDGITWLQVSDLQGWSNVAAKRYKVSSIPATVLLDRDGRIIAKNLRGPALEAKLAEVLGEG